LESGDLIVVMASSKRVQLAHVDLDILPTLLALADEVIE